MNTPECASGEVKRIFEYLRRMPMFSGIRYPVIRLAAETNKLLVKTGTAPVEMPKMPTLRIQKLWGGAMSDT